MSNIEELIQDRIRYLRDNTDFVSTLFESLIGYAIIAADFDGNIIAYNEGARQICGYVPEEIIGKKDIEIFSPKDFIEAGKLENIIEELIDKGRFSYEGEKVRKDSSTTPKLSGGDSITEAHISTITDSIILLRYVEIFGEMRRRLPVLKMRGSMHDKEIREFTIDDKGMHIGKPFCNITGILSGHPTHRPSDEVERISGLFAEEK